ncbi:hypothetical protein [Vibrio phage YC]|uniref:Uncharacterized protein n=1 Tax=Vibrio phage YC TaxID=2267403 RepID=A0A384ZS57_9CAUD|nr:hypothetical protein HWB64_gp101 [Vibrio phage YC]AXC34470.1 hypothetical protein [Vibrio phage YC]
MFSTQRHNHNGITMKTLLSLILLTFVISSGDYSSTSIGLGVVHTIDFGIFSLNYVAGVVDTFFIKMSW